MRYRLFSLAALALGMASVVHAESPVSPDRASQGLTREQVLAELAEAKRTGEFVVTQGSTTKKLNEFYPNSYPAKAVTSGLTREQVLAELAEAKRTGEFVVTQGSTTKKLNEFFPNAYPKNS